MKHLPFIILLACLAGCGTPQRHATHRPAGAAEQARFPLMAWDYADTDKTLVKTVPNGEFVVGDFAHENGARYVMVVNKNLKQPAVCDPQFNQPVKALQFVSPVTGQVKRFPAPYYWLSPGQGVLLKLDGI